MIEGELVPEDKYLKHIEDGYRSTLEVVSQFKAQMVELKTRITDVADNLLGIQEVAPSIELLDRIESHDLELRLERDQLRARVEAWRAAATVPFRHEFYCANGGDEMRCTCDRVRLVAIKCARAFDSVTEGKES